MKFNEISVVIKQFEGEEYEEKTEIMITKTIGMCYNCGEETNWIITNSGNYVCSDYCLFKNGSNKITTEIK